MIHTNELRIGNLIEYEKTTHIVCGMKDNMIYSWWFKNGKPVIEEIQKDISGVLVNDPYFDFCENHNPIPLTHELLPKLGFELFPWGWVSKVSEGRRSLRITINNYFEREGQASLKIEFVHQLQNLYFVLTGEELSIGSNGI